MVLKVPLNTGVLIESYWNLKDKEVKIPVLSLSTVLIESDWNLKLILAALAASARPVLIESDWNLK